jgi:hypothetical protein
VVSDRRASLDDEADVKPALRRLVEEEFRRGNSLPVMFFPVEGSEIPDTPRLTLVVTDPELGWTGDGELRGRIAEWTQKRGKSPRLYPGALVWCLKKPSRDLREKIELSLAWKRVAREIAEGTLPGDFDRADRAELQSRVKDAEGSAREEVWGGYRFAVVADGQEPYGLKVIDLGAGHSSSSESLSGRVVAALKSGALLNESVGAAYIDRNWPPALKESGAWPLSSLRQSFLNGSLTRLIDPDAVLRSKIVEFVSRGEFGLASDKKADGGYERVWFEELVPADEVSFEAGVFLLRKGTVESLQRDAAVIEAPPVEPSGPSPTAGAVISTGPEREPAQVIGTSTIRLTGNIPPEVWNRLGTRILPKLRSGSELRVGVDFSVTVNAATAGALVSELRQMLEELGLESVSVEQA